MIFKKHISHHTGTNLSIMHINCRSISKNFDDILNLLHPVTTLPTVLAVTETWLTEDTQNLFQIPGYNFITQSRLTENGGVGLFVGYNFTCNTLLFLCIQTTE